MSESDQKSREIFGRAKAVVGMVHVGALPGTPASRKSVPEIAVRAADEAETLVAAGFDAVIIENMHDRPYLRRQVGPEIVASMTAVGTAVRGRVDCPIGVQILAGANREALAVAQAIGAQFIRAEGFVFAAVADEGVLDDADAGPLLRYRRQIGAESIAILCDIRKKHSSHAITSDLDLADWARGAEFFGAEGLIVTGTHTAEAVEMEDLATVRQVSSLPIIVGSGATPDSVGELLKSADAIIVGSALKRDGRWWNELDPARVQRFIGAVSAARSAQR